MRKRFLLVVLLSFLGGSSLSFGVSPFYIKKAEGWHFYEERDKKDTKSQENVLQEQTLQELTARERIAMQRALLEEALAVAILSPTKTHVRDYLQKQKALLDQSEAFAETFKRVIYLNPDLDESRAKPTNHRGRHIYLDEARKEVKNTLTALSKTHGLFLFLKKDCPYCHAFLPQVVSFAEENGFSLMAIYVGEGEIPVDLLKGFKGIVKDNGISKRFHITYFPTLLAINPKKNDVIPLAYGMVSTSEIEERLMLLSEVKPSKYKKGAGA